MKLSSKVKIMCMGAVVAASSIPAAAAEPANADSTSAAMATIVAGYLQNAFQRQYANDGVARQLFTDGIDKAFAAEAADEPYYQGLAQGLNIRDNIEQMRQQGYPIDNTAFLAALRKALNGESTGFTAATAGQYMDNIANAMHQADRSQQQAFLAEQAAREGVQQLPSGLLFEVITEGEGDTPTVDDTVEVFYTGRLADGTVFDGTKDTPAKFPVKRLIPGFTEGLTMMRPGGTYRIFIPSELGYGERGAGNDIPGGAALDFTITLVDIVK